MRSFASVVESACKIAHAAHELASVRWSPRRHRAETWASACCGDCPGKVTRGVTRYIVTTVGSWRVQPDDVPRPSTECLPTTPFASSSIALRAGMVCCGSGGWPGGTSVSASERMAPEGRVLPIADRQGSANWRRSIVPFRLSTNTSNRRQPLRIDFGCVAGFIER